MTLTRKVQMTTQSNEPTELLFNRGTLMDLFIGKPTFQKKLRPNDILMDGINEDVLYLGHKKLLPKGATEELVTLEGRARRALADRSLQFPISGARFVQYTVLADLLKMLQEFKVEWNQKVDELVRDYPALREDQLANLDRQAEAIMQNELAKLPGQERERRQKELTEWLHNQKVLNRSLYPKTEDVKGMFRFEWRMFRVSAMSGVEEMSALQQTEIIEAREALRRDLQQWVRRAATEMHRTLGEAALNASSLLEKNGKLTARNMKPLFDAFDSFKAIDFTGASTFQQLVDQIRSQFGVTTGGAVNYELTASNISNTEAGMSQFRELLTQVSNLASEDVAEKAGLAAINQVGEFRRFIDA